MNRLQVFLRWTVAVCAAASLAACGGGGGGEGGSARPTAATGTFSTDSYKGTTDRVVDTLTATSVATSFAMPADASNSPAWRQSDRLAALVRTAFVNLQGSRRAAAAAVEPIDEACAGGGRLTGSISYKSPDFSSVGDYVELVAANCVDWDGVRYDGRLKVTLTAVAATSAQAELHTQNLLIAANGVTTTINGTARVSYTQTETKEAMRIAFDGLSATQGSQSYRWWHVLDYEDVYAGTTGPTVAFSGFVEVDGRYYQLQQRAPFTVYSMSMSGTLDIVDANGNRVAVSAAQERFTYTYYEAGSSTPKAGPVDGKPYAGLFY